ncbi:MAG TPA: ThiF family adenylyltransferase, partial [Blastocatellia bacterium]
MGNRYLAWYERHRERFEEERSQMLARDFKLNEEILATQRVVEFSGQSAVDSIRPLVVRYPEAFPSFPPRVFSDTPGNILVRAHQPNSKEVCLFGPGQTRWSAGRPGTEAIDEADAIIRQFGNATNPIQGDDVPEPSTAVYHYDPGISVLVPAGIATRVNPDSQGPVRDFNLSLSAEGRRERGVILNIRWSGAAIKAEQLYQSWFTQGRPVKGRLISLTAPPPYMTSLPEFESWLAGIGVRRDKWMAFVFPEESGSSSSSRISWLIVNSSPNGLLRLVKTFPIIPAERLARVPGAAGLANKKVVFIGCGNLGSKIAVPLAATGVSRFGLVDPESYEPENSVRHEVTIDQFGVPKVDALYRRLLGFNPEIVGQVDGSYTTIGGTSENQMEDERKLLDMIASADLVIDTTGSHGVSRFINEMCSELGIHSLYA